MTVKLDLTPEQESEVARQAQENGLAPDDYLRGLLQQTILPPRAPGTAPAARPQPDRKAMLALLDDLAHTDKYGTADEQRDGLDYLKSVIDADRPGQRRIFGQGDNPA